MVARKTSLLPSLLLATAALFASPAQAKDGVLAGGNGMTLYVFDKVEGDCTAIATATRTRPSASRARAASMSSIG